MQKQLKKRIHRIEYEQNQSIFENLDPGPSFWDFIKNAPILLKFDMMNSFHELFLHTKYEQNRSIFDHFQNFGPNYFDDTEKHPRKFLIYC